VTKRSSPTRRATDTNAPTFAEEIGSVALTPDATGGVFEVRVDGEIIWSRKEQGHFPDIKELKQLMRNRIAPKRSLGHSDRT
jgi:selenoprotein W-related protein